MCEASSCLFLFIYLCLENYNVHLYYVAIYKFIFVYKNKIEHDSRYSETYLTLDRRNRNKLQC